MTPAEIISLTGVAFLGLGLIGTWVRNGRSSSEKYGILTQKIEQTNLKLDEHSNKLDTIKTAVTEQKVNCATISSTLIEKVRKLEEEEH